MDIFTALAIPTRRSIVEILAIRGKLSATDIYSNFNVSPPAISQHLKVLRKANLVLMEKNGQHRMYQIDPKGVSQLESWTKTMVHLWNGRSDSLDELLKIEKNNY